MSTLDVTPSDAVAEAVAAAAAARQALAGDPTDTGLQQSLLLWLHRLAARYKEAGAQERSAGLAAEGAAVVRGSTASGDGLRHLASNLVYVAAYQAAGEEAVAATEVAVARLRELLATSDLEPTAAQGTFLWALHNLAARYKQADAQERSAGLAAEGAAVVRGSTASGNGLRLLASDLVYVAAYQEPGEEAVAATEVAVARLRELLTSPSSELVSAQWSFVWALHNLAARYKQIGAQERATGLGAEGAAVVQSSTATGTTLLDLASNLLYVSVSMAPGLEAVEAARTGARRIREVAAANPTDAALQDKRAWAERIVRDRLIAAGMDPDEPDEPIEPGGPAPDEITPAPPPADPWRVFGAGTPVTSIARDSDNMNVFAVGLDGAAWGLRWNGLWQEKQRIGRLAFEPGTPITTLARNPGQLDVFAVDDHGTAHSAWWNGEPWRDWFPLAGASFTPKTPLATLSRNPNHMEVWGVSDDGAVHGNWWNGDWQGWYQVGRQLFGRRYGLRPPIAALSRNPNQMDLFAVEEDGVVRNAWWNGDPWREWSRLDGHRFPPGAKLTVLSRNPNHMEVWGVDFEGYVWGNAWDGNWRGWTQVGTHRFAAGTTTVAAVSRNPNQMDLFAVDQNGDVWSAWWNGHWRDWFHLGGASFPAGSPMTAVSRNPNHMEVSLVGNDGALWGNWWDGDWHDWFRLPWSAYAFTRPITSGGIAALGGWATVAVMPDGATRWYGHAHNSGADSYSFGLSAILRGSSGSAVAFSRHGSVQGTLSIGGGRDHDWEIWSPPHPLVVNEFQHFRGGVLDSNLQYSSDIQTTLTATVDWAIKWMIGSNPLVMALGAVVFAGAIVGSLISQGSAVPGARLAGSMLWMAGPTNTILALAAEGIASAGSDERELSDEEYRWADQRVFRGTLPPREQLRLTDTIGQDNRAFCFPRFDGKITINMGAGSFADPRIHHSGSYGETFIHELVHAWQIRWNPMGLDLLARATVAQFNKSVLGGDPYALGAPGPAFNEFNLEQQGNIVSKWFARHHQRAADQPAALDTQAALNDPWFRYIQQNIRTGAM